MFVMNDCRLYLAALHFNTNSGRDCSTNKEGLYTTTVRIKTCAQGKSVIHTKKTEANFGKNIYLYIYACYKNGSFRVNSNFKTTRGAP